MSENGIITCGFDGISKVIENFGSPSYIFDINILRNRVEYLKSKLPEGTNLCYAMKANTFITKEVSEFVERIEACSPGEYNITDALGVDMKKLVISGVNKTAQSIEQMFAAHDDILVYTAESIQHYNIILGLARKYNRKVKLLIRLTSGNQFGMCKDDVKQIINDYMECSGANDIKDYLDIVGIHYFSGTQKHNLRIIRKELDKVFDFIAVLHDEFGYVCKELEYGGGFPVFYFQGDSFDEDEFLDGFRDNYNEALNTAVSEKGIEAVQLSIELGRSIAASCGAYITQLVDIKAGKDKKYAICDGGMNHLVYYGQTMAMKLPYMEHIKLGNDGQAATMTADDTESTEGYIICGSLCTINDIMVKEYNMKNAEIGDYLVFYNTGAYSMTEGISLFLSRELPQIIIGDSATGEYRVVRERMGTDKINCPN